MHHCKAIQDIYAREILDSRGNPTIETQVLVSDGTNREPPVFLPGRLPDGMRPRSCGTRKKRTGTADGAWSLPSIM